MAERICERCGGSFDCNRGATRFCEPCRTIVCRYCGDQFMVESVRADVALYCSRTCRARAYSDDWRPRFEKKIQRGLGCWEWRGVRNLDGYGVFSYHGVRLLAHRVAYADKYGAIPEGLSVLHHCDNPPCVRPGHLFVGTQADNIKDMNAKRRQTKGPIHNRKNFPRGTSHSKAKLAESDVLAIRAERERGLTFREIAQSHGISETNTKAIVYRQSWKHI